MSHFIKKAAGAGQLATSTIGMEKAILETCVAMETKLEGDGVKLGGVSNGLGFGGGLEKELQGEHIGEWRMDMGGEEGQGMAGEGRGGIGQDHGVEEVEWREWVLEQELGMDLLELFGGCLGRL